MGVKYFYINIIFLIAIFCTSCEKVINVDIDNVSKQYVIEGNITDNANSCKVNLSQTVNVSDSNKFDGVDGAIITISENGKPPIYLNSTGEGLYRANTSGSPGHKYSLSVQVDGKFFTATSTMPPKINFDSLYVTERLFLGKKRKLATVVFKDPPGLGNAYRFVQYVDGRKENTIFTMNDNLVDGRQVVYDLLIFGDDEYTLKKDDQLRVEMFCIDRFSFKYWFSLTQSSLGQNQSASPGNPLNPFSDGAIGYFSAHSFEARSIVVK